MIREYQITYSIPLQGQCCPPFRNTFPQKKDNANLKNGERREIHNLIDNLIQITPFKVYGDNR